jgi:hydroxymethylpyrimidine pyrophosphatase-like HAD family hydrolase/adenine/guanine phosphoribosyltransferase-like PRPP-binding protein
LPYAPVDLLHDLDGLAAALAGADEADDAFLLAGAIWQVLEDHRHRDVLGLGKVAEVVGGPPAAIALTLRRAGFALRAARPAERRVARCAGAVAILTERLADAVLHGRGHDDALAGALAHAVEDLAPAVRRRVLRLPGSFQTFDQHPADCAALARAYAARGEDRTTPLTVVGLRTSGTYLAPLVAAAVRDEGFHDITIQTLRPGQPSRRAERRALARARRVLVVDDPPRSGSAMAEALSEIEAAGVAPGAITLLLARFQGRESTPPLAGRDEVTLPFAEWDVNARLAPEATRAALSELLGAEVTSVEGGLAPPQRGHAEARYRVTLADGRALTVRARGAGWGFYARHAATLAARLDGMVPAPIGERDGILYEHDVDGAPPAADDVLAEQIASHVAARAERLAVPADLSLRIAGENAVWELAADALARAFGGLRPLMRPLAHATARALLAADRPAVIDGATAIGRWRREDGRLVKTGYDVGAFGAGDLFCYDPVYDVAGAAADAPELAGQLRAAWERRAAAVAPERWMLDQLVALGRARGDGDGRIERAMRRAHARWARERLLDGPRPQDGPLCALDVDGVLETRWNGFTAISPPAAEAVRALHAHGLRVAVCTGRSLDDVRERCEDYGLAAGVAEYGGVVFDGEVRVLLDPPARAAIDAVREALAARPGIAFGGGRVASVRAYRHDERGRRRGLDDADVAAALAAAGADRVTVAPGDRQTDFHAAGHDKAAGLRALLAGAPLALAVGDTENDATMLALAERAFAPSHARAALAGATGVTFTRGAYGFGARDAAAAYLGHAPGGCPVCARDPHPPAVDALLAALGARERDRWGKLRAAATIARALRRSGSRAPRPPA